MCNPRRIQVTATRSIAEAWNREVRRVASRSGIVRGEARVRQSLAASLGAPALAALERALDAGVPGWTLFGDVYRYDVEGGYALYSLDDRSLTIVAVAEEEVRAEGVAQASISGRVEEEISATGEGMYYDDNYGETSPERAAVEARVRAEGMLVGEAARRIQSAALQAEAEIAPDLAAEAERRANADYEARASARRADIQREVEARAGVIGVEIRRAFHALLARAYRDALLALARSRGAEGIRCSEDGESLEIEFVLPR